MKKLKEAGFIREIKYTTWLANIVPEMKSSGQWRMCTSFTDLSKACPKDPYPLPNIDHPLDGASRHSVLSFSNAYYRYH